MEIIDHTKAFQKLLNGELTWENYKRTSPEFFQHYFSFWANDQGAHRLRTKKELERRCSLVSSYLRISERKLTEMGYETDSLSAFLFVGQDTANGHALKLNGRFTAWLAIETFETSLQAKIFATHELFHAIHYRESPSCYFNGHEEMHSVSRQLITEGVATYLTKNLWQSSDGVALWADLLSPKILEDWLKNCERSKKALIDLTLTHFESPESGLEIFYASDAQSVLSFKGGLVSRPEGC